MSDSPPEQQPDESDVDYAQKLVARGHEGERIEFMMSLSAGTTAELAARAPPGATLQMMTRLAIGEWIATHRARDDAVAGSLDEIIHQLAEIRHAISDEHDPTIAELLQQLREKRDEQE